MGGGGFKVPNPFQGFDLAKDPLGSLGMIGRLNPTVAGFAFGQDLLNGKNPSYGPVGDAITGNQPSGAGSGSGGGKKGSPPPPNFTGGAEQQAAKQGDLLNQQTTANRPNTSTGFGSTNWYQGPDGQWVMSNQLAPGLEQSNQLAQSQFADALRQGLPTGDEARQQAFDAAYGQATSRLDPAFAQRERALQTQLANQGLDPTSEAYRTQMADFGRERNDAYTSAQNMAIGRSTDAGDAIFRQGLAKQAAPLGLLGGLQGLGVQPGFNAAGLAPGPDYLRALEAQYGVETGKYKADQQAQSQRMTALASLAPYLMSLSDERAKVDIEREDAEAYPGVPWATWRWRDAPGERVRGVIAQDVARVAPQFVHVRGDGMLMVDYGGLLTSPEARRAR